MIRVGRGQDSIFVQIDLPCSGVTSALREKDGFLDDLGIGMIHLDQVPESAYRVIDAFPVRLFPLMEATSFFAVLMTVASKTGASIPSALMDESHEMAQISATELNVEDAKQFVERTQDWLRSNPTWAERLLAGWQSDQNSSRCTRDSQTTDRTYLASALSVAVPILGLDECKCCCLRLLTLGSHFFLKYGHGFSGLLIPLTSRNRDTLGIHMIGLCDFPQGLKHLR